MDIDATIGALQEYGDYRAAKKMLRRDGYFSLFFGALGIAVGIRMLRHGPLGTVILALGAYLEPISKIPQQDYGTG